MSDISDPALSAVCLKGCNAHSILLGIIVQYYVIQLKSVLDALRTGS